MPWLVGELVRPRNRVIEEKKGRRAKESIHREGLSTYLVAGKAQ